VIEQLIFALIVLSASVGVVVLIHTSPIPIPNMKPFNCAFCAIVWISWAIWGSIGWMDHEHRLLNLLLAMAFPFPAALIVGHFPWMFRNFEKPKALVAADDVETQLHDFAPTDERPPTGPVR